MEAKELRIGNLLEVDYKDVAGEYIGLKIIIVQYINYDLFNECWLIGDQSGGDQYLELLKPIPLTEEWLVRLTPIIADTVDDEDGTRCSYQWYYLDGYIYDDNNFAMCNRLNWKKIMYLHELQNFYFIMTGKELTKMEESKTRNKKTII